MSLAALCSSLKAWVFDPSTPIPRASPKSVRYLQILSSNAGKLPRILLEEAVQLAGVPLPDFVTYSGREKGFAVIEASGLDPRVVLKLAELLKSKYNSFNPDKALWFPFSSWIDGMVMPEIRQFLESEDFKTSCLATRTWLGAHKISSFADLAQCFADLKKIALERNVPLPAEIAEEGFDFRSPASIIEKLKKLDAYIQEHDPENIQNLKKVANWIRFNFNAQISAEHPIEDIRTWLNSQPEETFANVTEVFLCHLDLTMIPYEIIKILEKCRNLQTLDLSANPIKVIPHDFLHTNIALRTLDLSSNQITEIPDGFLNANTALQWLFLFKNQIKVIQEGFLHTNTALEWLDLFDNQITEIPDGFLNANTALQWLFLFKNQIKVIPDSLLENNPLHLDTFSISGNPICKYPSEAFLSRLRPELRAQVISNLPLMVRARKTCATCCENALLTIAVSTIAAVAAYAFRTPLER